MLVEIAFDETERFGNMLLYGVDGNTQLCRDLFVRQVLYPAHVEYPAPLRGQRVDRLFQYVLIFRIDQFRFDGIFNDRFVLCHDLFGFGVDIDVVEVIQYPVARHCIKERRKGKSRIDKGARLPDTDKDFLDDVARFFFRFEQAQAEIMEFILIPDIEFAESGLVIAYN